MSDRRSTTPAESFSSQPGSLPSTLSSFDSSVSNLPAAISSIQEFHESDSTVREYLNRIQIAENGSYVMP
jgi:hypothetical protein